MLVKQVTKPIKRYCMLNVEDRGGVSLTKCTILFPKTDLIYTGKDLNAI